MLRTAFQVEKQAVIQARWAGTEATLEEACAPFMLKGFHHFARHFVRRHMHTMFIMKAVLVPRGKLAIRFLWPSPTAAAPRR